MTIEKPLARATAFCQRFGLSAPILMGPMAGSSPPALAAAVANAGAMGACGALLLKPEAISAWMADFRALSVGPVQINLWMPEPLPQVDAAQLSRLRERLSARGHALGALTPQDQLPSFNDQCEALLAARPAVASSIMGLWPNQFVAALKQAGIAWFANVSCLEEARAAEAAGADAIVVSGIEAGGHRPSFDAAAAAHRTGTIAALVPQIANAVQLPIIAAGAIADGRSLASALTLGASAVQIGTALLRAPEAATHPVWSAALTDAAPEDTVLTRAFTGRLARGLRNLWTEELGDDALPYPLQRWALGPMRTAAAKAGDAGAMQMWAGQNARLAQAKPAGEIITAMWRAACALLA